MATSIGQYAPVFLPGEPPSLTEKPGRPQSLGLQRVGHYQSDPVCIDGRLFLPVVALPQWELSVKVVQLLGLQGPWRCQTCRDMDCLHRRSYGPIRVFFSSWQSEDLFGQSFSVAPPVSTYRAPCLGFFSAVLCVMHIEVPPWLGSYSVGRRIRRLKGRPGWVLLCSSVWQVFSGPDCLLFSFLWEFCMVLYALLHWSGTPVHCQLAFGVHFCVWRCIPGGSVEREVLHIHLLLCHLVLPCTWFLKFSLSVLVWVLPKT